MYKITFNVSDGEFEYQDFVILDDMPKTMRDVMRAIINNFVYENLELSDKDVDDFIVTYESGCLTAPNDHRAIQDIRLERIIVEEKTERVELPL